MDELVDDLVALCRTFGMAEREQICCGTVTVPQCVCLQVLLAGPSEAGPLADQLGSSPSATTRLVDGLVKRGWAERARDAADRRKVHIGLTPEGEAEAKRLRGMTGAVVQAMMAHVPRAKHAQVIESIRLVRQAVEATRETIRGCCG